jgi:hypothetical protein
LRKFVIPLDVLGEIDGKSATDNKSFGLYTGSSPVVGSRSILIGITFYHDVKGHGKNNTMYGVKLKQI